MISHHATRRFIGRRESGEKQRRAASVMVGMPEATSPAAGTVRRGRGHGVVLAIGLLCCAVRRSVVTTAGNFSNVWVIADQVRPAITKPLRHGRQNGQ